MGRYYACPSVCNGDRPNESNETTIPNSNSTNFLKDLIIRSLHGRLVRKTPNPTCRPAGSTKCYASEYNLLIVLCLNNIASISKRARLTDKHHAFSNRSIMLLRNLLVNSAYSSTISFFFENTNFGSKKDSDRTFKL